MRSTICTARVSHRDPEHQPCLAATSVTRHSIVQLLNSLSFAPSVGRSARDIGASFVVTNKLLLRQLDCSECARISPSPHLANKSCPSGPANHLAVSAWQNLQFCIYLDRLADRIRSTAIQDSKPDGWCAVEKIDGSLQEESDTMVTGIASATGRLITCTRLLIYQVLGCP
ncbi:hypothetical protein BDV19DRAFT_352643 [Aspergillus venezuelensis]